VCPYRAVATVPWIAGPPCAPYPEAPDGPVRAGPQPGMSDVAQATGKAHATPTVPWEGEARIKRC